MSLPTYAKFCRLPPQKLQDAKQAFAEMERMGICKKSSSPWASPLHMVKKSDVSWRPCSDYRRLNLITMLEHYPLSNMQDLIGALHGAKFSPRWISWNTTSKFQSIQTIYRRPPSSPRLEHLPSPTWPSGSETLGRCSNDSWTGFWATFHEHLDHVRTVLKRLQENGFVIRFDKCTFGAEKVDFLGHEISSSGVRPMASKVDAVSKFPTPSTVKGLQEFIDMVNYYHRSVPEVAKTMLPLNKPPSRMWNGSWQERSCWPTRMTGTPLRLTTDASNLACGVVLEQMVNGRPQPLAFYSRKLKPAETRYSNLDRELTVVYLTCLLRFLFLCLELIREWKKKLYFFFFLVYICYWYKLVSTLSQPITI